MNVYLSEGKVLLGADGKVAVDAACCCPTPPSCGTNSLTLNKCGFDPFTGADGRKFLVSTYDATHDQEACCQTSGGSCLEATSRKHGTGNRTRTYNTDDCSVNLVINSDITNFTHCDGSTATGSFGENSGATYTVISATYKERVVHNTGTCSGSYPKDVGCTGDSPATEDFFDSYTLSSEYTTAMLISNTLAAFTAAYGDCPAGCTLTYTLSGDESSCTASCTPA